MQVKDKLEYCMFLSKAHRAEFVERRKHEWKVVFTLITFYVAAIASVYSGRVLILEDRKCLIVGIVGAVFVVLAAMASIYLAYVHMANNKNKTFAENAERLGQRLIKNETVSPNDIDVFNPETRNYWTSWTRFWGKEGRWGFCWQLSVIAIFAIAAVLLLVFYNPQT